MNRFFMAAAAICAAIPLFSSELILAENGRTSYQIVTSSRTAKDEWNARFLRWYLKERTGADFPVVRPQMRDTSAPSIFIGICPPVNAIWGTPPLAGLKKGEWLVASRGKDIFLLGKGFDADFDAVMDFIFTELDQKWYLRNPPPKVIRQNRLALQPFNRKGKWAFNIRLIGNSRGNSDYFRGNTNSAFCGWQYRTVRRMPERYPLGFNVSLIYGETDPVIQPETFEGSWIHNQFSFIPPAEKAKDFEWLPRSHYFKSHPEFFSMDELGRRTGTNQLCLSGKAVRQELLKNAELYFDAMGTDNLVIGFCYMDSPHKACHCPACKALEEKYGTPGAAMFDFLLEAGAYMAKHHPKTVIRCILYYEKLTLFPPKIQVKFPENVQFRFCPIENAINRNWDYPKNQERFKLLTPWCTMTDRGMEVWLYALGPMRFLPFCNTEMAMETIQHLYKIGVKGIFYEYTPGLAGFGDDYVNFEEMDLYLFYQLMRKPDLDLAAAIQEFFQANYGKAAPLISRYYRELHDASCKDNPHDFRWNNEFNFFKGNFGYLTLERLYRWSKLFDEMVKLEPENHLIRNQRVSVDCAVYGRWAELAEKYPDYFKDPALIRTRIGTPKGSNAKDVEKYLKECQARLALAGVRDKKNAWKGMTDVNAQFNFLMSRAKDSAKDQDYDTAIEDLDHILSLKITPVQKSSTIYLKGYYLSRQRRFDEADKLYRDSLKNDKHSDSMIWEFNYVYVPILLELKKYDEVFEALDTMKKTGKNPKETLARIQMVEKQGVKRPVKSK